jgi:hypothetical protein
VHARSQNQLSFQERLNVEPIQSRWSSEGVPFLGAEENDNPYEHKKLESINLIKSILRIKTEP